MPVQAKAEALPIAGDSVDLIVVAQALHWFERDAFFAEVQRIAVKGGVLVVWSYGLLSIDPEVDRWVNDLYNNTLRDHWDPARQLVESGYSEIEFPFQAIPTPVFTMTAQWDRAQLLGYLETWSALYHYRHSTGKDPMPALSRHLSQVWTDENALKTIQWPLNLRAFRAR
jgi:SAM-dependent methyltransferase